MPLIDCPLCKGTGRRYDTDAAEWTQETCTACQGSKTLSTDRATWQSRGQVIAKNAWTDKDNRYLREAREAGVTFADIAAKLGRTRAAVISKRTRLIKEGEWE